MGMFRSAVYVALAAGALYVGAKTGGCDYVLERFGAPDAVRAKARDSSSKYVKTIDSVADTAKSLTRNR